MAMSLVVLVCLLIAGAVALYVGYTRRGQAVPHAPWLGRAMSRGVAVLPTIGNQAEAPGAERLDDSVLGEEHKVT